LAIRSNQPMEPALGPAAHMTSHKASIQMRVGPSRVILIASKSGYNESVYRTLSFLTS
jgi:hypothetical protein